jgi:3-oxoacyl-[acyl-carrier-protein] synthase-3
MYTDVFSKEVAEAIVAKTGIEERRFAEDGVCASDLCFEAAKKLIEENQINRDEIKFLIFVSQTPDYRMPATGILLQERLGLSKDCMALDINLGCSGFIYGLSVIYGLMQSATSGKGLLLVGETRSRVYSDRDRKTAFLFGDAGIACLIDKGAVFGSSHFDLHSDGSQAPLIKMDAGGYRNPSTIQTREMKVRDADGNARSDEHGYMDGAEVFNFVLTHIPKGIKGTLKRINMDINVMDCYVFHQANLFMNRHLVKKLKLDEDRVLNNVNRFGNTSSVSIPLAIVTEFSKINHQENLFSLLCGFGVGMSWANAVLKLGQIKIGELIEC